MDHRLARGAVDGLDAFDTLQTLYEAGVDRLDDGRLGELTPGMRALVVLFVFCGQVDNGGFASCVFNSGGDWTADAIGAARRIGAAAHAAVFERFADIGLGGDLGMPWEARNARLDAMSDREAEALEALDEAFYALEPIDAILGRYLSAHPQEFFRDT